MLPFNIKYKIMLLLPFFCLILLTCIPVFDIVNIKKITVSLLPDRF